MRNLLTFSILVLGLLLPPAIAATPGWKAGAAKVAMTPGHPLWLAGFGSRTHPSEGIGMELYARALAMEDPGGRRAVILSTDMLGFPRDFGIALAERVYQKYRVPRERLLLNSSHTHCGPVIGRLLEGAYNMTREQWADVDNYTRELEDKLVVVIGEALKNLTPASLMFGQTEASFGVNRRDQAGKNWGHPDYAAPADHDVPVLRIQGQNGSLVAVVFGYGCHPSTIPYRYYKFHGDYAGVAAKYLEDRHPGSVALFVQGTGGDVKPFPFGTVELAESYGQLLGASVEFRIHEELRTNEAPLVPVSGSLACAFEAFPLAFATPPGREQWEARAKGDAGSHRYADYMLRIIDRDGQLPKDHPYPIQVWRFGKDLTLLAMGGEVLSGYSLRLKRELAGTRLWVAGYSNDDMGYIPTEQVLREGGYEGADAMVPYMQPGPWAPGVEETIVSKVHQLLKTVGEE